MNNEEKILAMLEKHSGVLERLEKDVSGIKLRLDVDMERKLDLLAEGHETLMGRMSPKSRVEALEDEMAFMKSVVKDLSREVAELKEAQ